jgi:probable HAF family extracellular repeat protein
MEATVKHRILTILAVIAFLAALALPTLCLAQKPHHKLPHYTVIDLGTLGGTFSGAEDDAPNRRGQVDGYSTLPGDNVVHGFLWDHGRMIDLGTLGGPNSMAVWQLNDWGAVPVMSDTTTLDPNDEDYCFLGTDFICRAFIWHQGLRITLPSLGNAQVNTWGAQINNWGQMVGASEIDVRNPTCPPRQGPGYTQVLFEHPVIWELGQVRELPILPGDTSGAAFVINDLGQIGVLSSPDCATNVWHILLYDHGAPIYLGTLGGQALNIPQAINNKTQMVGGSDLSGDTVNHAFLWERGVMTDLGTLPGYPNSIALGINDQGQVVGGVSDEPFLGGNCSAFFWQDGVMTDLNTLIPSGSPLFLWWATGINSRGQIEGQAVVVSTGEWHAFLATPVESERDVPFASGATRERPKVTVPENVRKMLQRRAHFGGLKSRNDSATMNR